MRNNKKFEAGVFDGLFPSLDHVWRNLSSIGSPADAWNIAFTTTANVVEQMRSSIEGDRVRLSLDIPGAKREDVNVEFDTDATISVRYRRADSGAEVHMRYYIDLSWDKDTASAKVEDGVLTVEMKTSAPPAKQARKIQVK